MKRTKMRMLCLILTALLLIGLAACGRSDPPPMESSEEDGAGSASSQASATTEQNANAGEMVSPKTVDTTLWDLSYDEADGWIYEEDELYDDDTYSDIILTIPDETGDSDLINVEISVSIEDRDTSATILPAMGLTNTNMQLIRPMTLPK